MQGPTLSRLVDGLEVDASKISQKNHGIISFSFEHLFEAISVAHDLKYLVVCSYLEIYNENIRDLLSNDPSNNLKLKEHQTEGVIVENLSRHPVHNVSECEQLLMYGAKNRKVGATLMNGRVDTFYSSLHDSFIDFFFFHSRLFAITQHFHYKCRTNV
jgi:Kinesin motor domain